MSCRRDPFALSQVPAGIEFYFTPTSKESYFVQGYDKINGSHLIKRVDCDYVEHVKERVVFVDHYTPWRLLIKRSKSRGITEYHMERSTGLPRVTRTASYVQYDGYKLEQLFNIIEKSI